jgi:hypothetical protein
MGVRAAPSLKTEMSPFMRSLPDNLREVHQIELLSLVYPSQFIGCNDFPAMTAFFFSGSPERLPVRFRLQQSSPPSLKPTRVIIRVTKGKVALHRMMDWAASS